jgi:hypothetical protein
MNATAGIAADDNTANDSQVASNSVTAAARDATAAAAAGTANDD